MMHYRPTRPKISNTVMGLIGMLGLVYMVITGWVAYGYWSLLFDGFFIGLLAYASQNSKTR